MPGRGVPGDGAGYDRGFDRLTLLQDGGPIQSSSTYWMGPQIGSGIYTIVGGGPGDTQTVFFEELEPVIDVVPAVTHTINATPENNAIDYAAGPNSGIISLLNPAGDITGQVTVDNYEADEFANKTNVVINALAGDDVININLVPTPTGLSGTVAVDAGAPAVPIHWSSPGPRRPKRSSTRRMLQTAARWSCQAPTWSSVKSRPWRSTGAAT